MQTCSCHALPVPTEGEEQQAVFQWAALAQGKWSELRLLYHIPNEGKRTAYTGARLRSEGLRQGVPDICLPVPKGGYCGLYIELKRSRNSKTSDAQKEWLEALKAAGNCAMLCKGAEEAIAALKRSLSSGEGEKR